jgi:hypothetical protein
VTKRILSLGAGVQSSTLALMITHGIVDSVDAAIFADTQWEPRKVYDWLDWLEGKVSFPIIRVTKGNLRADTVAKQQGLADRVAAIPWHLKTPEGERAMGRRQCTVEYKINPISRKARELSGLVPRQRVKAPVCEMLIGISTDEVMRMKPSDEAWKTHRWPLVELGMSRWDCVNWMKRNGYPEPPKSSCIGCPYHNDHEWRLIKADAESWADAVELDRIIRHPAGKMKSEQFMHRSCKPLDEVDLTTAEDHGQVDMFNNECEGMCGV